MKNFGRPQSLCSRCQRGYWNKTRERIVHLLKLKCRFGYVTSFRTFAPPTPLFAVDIHPTAVIDPTATICSGARMDATLVLKL
jgi:hypothetical protein